MHLQSQTQMTAQLAYLWLIAKLLSLSFVYTLLFHHETLILLICLSMQVFGLGGGIAYNTGHPDTYHALQYLNILEL